MKKLTVGILAHVDSGKTTLSEAMMYLSGNLNRLGRVDHRDSFLDNFAQERERGITIFSKQAVMNFRSSTIYLLDTPGHVDFSAETERTLGILDYAVLVISGTDSVQSHTLTLWKLLRKYSVPTFIFVNKMDMAGADRKKVFNELKEKLSARCVDFGESDESLYEDIALCDDLLLEKYYSTDLLEHSDVVSAVKNRKVFPVMFGSALKLDGVEQFMGLLDDYTSEPDYTDAFSARVYKIAQDSSGNRLTYLKVTGGTLKVRDIPRSDKNTENEKINQIRVYSGEKFTPADSAESGTVCAVTGLSFTLPGDGLGEEGESYVPVLRPVLTYSVILPDGVDVHTALSKFRMLEQEDPTLGVSYDERHGEIQIKLMGDIQLEILKSLIEERFRMSVEFSEGSIIYKETIEDEIEGVGHFEPLRHYAEVHLALRPLKRDSGLVFKTECREDMLDKNWQRLILTHLYEKTHIGVLTGSPITDMEISLLSGRAHPKHTEGGDFRQATYRAVRQGLMSAKTVLLEPIYEYTLTVPSENIGRAMSDITRMHGDFEPPVTTADSATLCGTAPVATMRGYTREVIAYTRGEGRLSLSIKGYAPCHNADEVIAQISYDPEKDTENTPDSVFCSHGAGHTVKWSEVRANMHLPSALNNNQNSPAPAERDLSRYKSQKDIFALDKELMRIFEQTYGPVKRKTYSEPKRYKTVEYDPNKRRKNLPSDVIGDEYLLVDGYNVIHAWDNLNIYVDGHMDTARSILINILCNYQGYRKCRLILVFDAYKIKGHEREVEKLDNITVVYTKEAETADRYIERASYKLAKNNRVRVVTSDGMEQLIILGTGAIRVSSREFYDEVKQAEEEIREIIG